MKRNQPQVELVRAHLKRHGYITDLVAQNYGVKRLAARIYDIEAAGTRVDREMRRDDAGVRYTYYTLA